MDTCIFSPWVGGREYENDINLASATLFCETIALCISNARDFLKTLCKVASEIKMSVLVLH